MTSTTDAAVPILEDLLNCTFYIPFIYKIRCWFMLVLCFFLAYFLLRWLSVHCKTFGVEFSFVLWTSAVVLSWKLDDLTTWPGGDVELCAGRLQLLVAVVHLGNQRFAHAACLERFRLFVGWTTGCNNMKLSELSSWMNGRDAALVTVLLNSLCVSQPLVFLVRGSEADVCRPGFFSLWETA